MARFAVVAVAGGKGGVGKSTVSLNLALALRERGARVGILDADLYGPDVPLMVGVTRTAPLRRWDFWRADKGTVTLEPYERFGIKIMSAGFLVAERQALDWPAPAVDLLTRQLLRDVAWGDIDVLVVDLPPGTADVPQQVTKLLAPVNAIVVVGPQDLAHLDAKKVLSMLEDAGARVLGGVENMSGLVCPNCEHAIDVFPRVAEERSIWALGVPLLSRIPLDPALARPSETPPPVFLDLAAAVQERLAA